jgi:VWFA-related protein
LIKVGVEEVRIDAVVLNNKGKQVTDLTADDFEIYQDNVLQKTVSSRYVNESQDPAAPSKKSMRNIAIVVDDLFMNLNQLYYARMALQKYIEQQMEPGDNVTIIRTGIGGVQPFSSDKEYLLSRIMSLKPGRSQLVDPTSRLDDLLNNNPQTGASRMQMDNVRSRIEVMLNAYSEIQNVTLNLSIAFLRDMPGRKHLVFVSPQIYYNAAGDLGKEKELRLIKVAENALRAGVVVYTLDVKGLNTTSALDYHQNYLPLSRMTGGILVENSNFFLHGIEPVVENMKGYYLLSYVPPPNTFGSNSQKQYHRIKIKVKRRGYEVHSRDGFHGAPSLLNASPEENRFELTKAVFSPFLYNDLKIILSSGFAHNPKSGYFLKSWVHIDSDKLTFVKDDIGERSLKLEMQILTFNDDGRNTDSSASQYGFILNNDDIASIKSKGIDLNMYLPIKNPGDYYVCVAIRDKASGKIGTGYQYINIPDLHKEQLALSSIFILNKGEDAAGINPGIIESNVVDRNYKWQAMPKSPALRIYHPGDSIDFVTFVYNAKTKANSIPRLEYQYYIMKDGEVYSKGSVENIDSQFVDNAGQYPILKKILLDGKMAPGTYQLHVAVRDKSNKIKFNTAMQAIDFEITNSPEDIKGRSSP